MMVPSNFIRYSVPSPALGGLRGLRGGRGMRGLGEDGIYLANPDNACPPGLVLINGSCFRSSGSQSTPYGTVAIPDAGPESNNDVAEKLLGGGATCNVERVSNGPYSYEQNICRDANGNIIGGADNIAETAWVEASLRNPSNPQIFVTPAPTDSGGAQSREQGTQTGRGGSQTGAPNGSGNKAAQTQTPGTDPKTVQGSKESKEVVGGDGEQAAADDGNSFVILGIAAVAAFFLLKGGR